VVKETWFFRCGVLHGFPRHAQTVSLYLWRVLKTRFLKYPLNKYKTRPLRWPAAKRVASSNSSQRLIRLYTKVGWQSSHRKLDYEKPRSEHAHVRTGLVKTVPHLGMLHSSPPISESHAVWLSSSTKEAKELCSPPTGGYIAVKLMEAYWPRAAALASTSIRQSLMGSPPRAALYRSVIQGLVMVMRV
jgi:hypothetical protein